MRLPEGVTHHPRCPRLIAKDADAVIQIDTSGQPANAAYCVNDRSFDDAVAPYLQGDWAEHHRLFRLCVRGTVAYSGAEHRGEPKRPNITVVPNLAICETRGLSRPTTVFGCTMGHYHPGTAAGWRIQEVYEFQSFGLLVLDHEDGRVELWVARDGCKVAVPNACHMTLYNLGDADSPLITLDFADPERNPTDKDLIKRCGPILLAWYDEQEVMFRLNRLYVNNPEHRAGVRLAGTPASSERELQVRIPVGARLELGRLLYDRLTKDPEVIGRFARLGLVIRKATPEAVVAPLCDPSSDGGSLSFRQPLVEAAKPGTDAYRYFINNSWRSEPGPARGRGIRAVMDDLVTEKAGHMQAEELKRPLLIVVEGSGDWVTQAYRPLFRKKAASGDLVRVFYADDTRWKPRPEWTSPDALEPWETYLDKAYRSDYTIYRRLAPDVVFVVTPDFTHASIASSWLGRAPLVLVEKPFDSQAENVDSLLKEIGRHRGTAILGLDHFQFYALPVHEMRAAIEEHLGGAIAEVRFYMIEDRPIELDRVRTLQYGLTLDMLPHCHALLTYFGDAATIDDVRVLQAGQYRPFVAASRDGTACEDITGRFRNETASRTAFTFRDYSSNGHHVPCVAVVGKGFRQSVKYLEVTGRSGHAIRVDLNRRPDPDPACGYPWDCLFFLLGDEAPPPAGVSVHEVQDPYASRRTLRIVEDPQQPERWRRPLARSRYETLLDDLIHGTRTAAASTLLMTEAPEIVEALDRLWRAIQEARPRWKTYELGKSDPIDHW